jgi:hypothetical protein
MTLSKPPAPLKLASYLPVQTVRVKEAISALQAAQQAPSLAVLTRLAKQSSECLRLVSPLIPASMHASVQAGPLEYAPPSASAPQDQNKVQWCLLAANSAVAAKLRHLLPSLTAHLRTHGHEIHEIRIKIAMQKTR